MPVMTGCSDGPATARRSEIRTHPKCLDDRQSVERHRLTAVEMRESGKLHWMCTACGQVWRQAETFQNHGCEKR